MPFLTAGLDLISSNHLRTFLNESKSENSNADFAKAKKYVKSGGKVDAIKSKYSLTQAQETELQSL